MRIQNNSNLSVEEEAFGFGDRCRTQAGCYHSSTVAHSLSKVADCICLMALDKPQAVPVDVHVWQIAQRDYSWHPTTSQARGPSPQANKELGEERGWDVGALD